MIEMFLPRLTRADKWVLLTGPVEGSFNEDRVDGSPVAKKDSFKTAESH